MLPRKQRGHSAPCDVLLRTMAPQYVPAITKHSIKFRSQSEEHTTDYHLELITVHNSKYNYNLLQYGMYTIQPNLLLCVPVRVGDEEVCLIRSFFVSDAVSVLMGEINLTREHSWRSEFTNTTPNPLKRCSPPPHLTNPTRLYPLLRQHDIIPLCL